MPGKIPADRMVGEFNQYKETLVPTVRFMSEKDAIAVGEDVLSIYTMKDKPSLKKEIKFQDEIQKVFYGDEYIGFVSKTQIIKIHIGLRHIILVGIVL